MTLEKPLTDGGNSPDNMEALNQRIARLEHEIQAMRKTLAEQEAAIAEIDHDLPVTNLLSNSFLTRAFAAWGHVFVAQLIVALIFYVLVFFLRLLVGGS